MPSDPTPRSRITAEVVVGQDCVPDTVGVRWVAQVFGISRRAVLQAIRAGTLPATRDGDGRCEQWSIKPSDAVLRWGYRLNNADREGVE